MIVDIHTHTFPDRIRAHAMSRLSDQTNMRPFSDGSIPGLAKTMKTSGVDYSVVLPVATSPTQYHTINRVAIETNEHTTDTGILSFGSLHPENENYREILKELADHNVLGIKLHPIFQQCPIDDIRNLRIIDCACEYGLVVLMHAGYDVGYPRVDICPPDACRRMIEEIKPDKLIMAHMGGWGHWEEVEEYLLDLPVWFDTSTCLTLEDYGPKKNPDQDKWLPDQLVMSSEQFVRIVRKIGPDRVLMGSDSPWNSQAASIKAIQKCRLSEKEKAMILGENAGRLLGLVNTL